MTKNTVKANTEEHKSKLKAVVYVDTWACLCQHNQPKEVLGPLRKELGKNFHYKDTNAYGYSKKLEVNKPNQAAIDLISKIDHNKRITTRVDVAFDFLCVTKEEAEELAAYLDKHLVQKWRPKSKRCTTVEGTRYWGKDGTGRSFAVYADKPSPTGRGYCCHLELRIKGSVYVRRNGLRGLSSVKRPRDGMAILKHQTTLKKVDHKRYQRQLEKVTLFNKRRYKHIPVDRLKRRIEGLFLAGTKTADLSPSNIDQISAQDFHDHFGKPFSSSLVKLCDWDDLSIEIHWLGLPN